MVKKEKKKITRQVKVKREMAVGAMRVSNGTITNGFRSYYVISELSTMFDTARPNPNLLGSANLHNI